MNIIKNGIMICFQILKSFIPIFSYTFITDINKYIDNADKNNSSIVISLLLFYLR